MVFVFIIIGLIVGSFVGAFTYRFPRGLSFVFGRSFCPICKSKINWYDNIPLLSFVFLSGRCRVCRKKISWRYPIIEISTAFGFLFVYILVEQSRVFHNLDSIALPYLLFVFLILEIIFIIDLEHKVVFDSLVFFLFALVLFTSLFLSDNLFWDRIFSALFVSSILLILNLITNGKGMGLGDVKLALPLGFFLGFPASIFWLFVSFFSGAFIGIFLIFMGKAKFGKQVPFAPFLIISFWITLALGKEIIVFFDLFSVLSD